MSTSSGTQGADEATSAPEIAVATQARIRPAHVWEVAKTPRMIGFAIVIIIAVMVTVKLGTWQLDRAVARAEQGQIAELNARLESDPEPLTDIVEPQTGFVQSMVGQRVEVAGVFEGPEFFVPRKFKPDEENPKDKSLWTHGYWVLSPLRTDDGAIMPVVRGWVEENDPDYLNADGTAVTVVGALDGGDPSEGNIEGNMIPSVSTGQLANVWDGALYSGYLIATSSSGEVPAPSDLPELTPAATPTLEGGGMNLRNLAYAGEWFIFGGFAVAVWWRMVRDESRDLANRERAARADA